jgi:hypothetical protein
LEAVRNASGGFDVDAFHVMDERDNQLIEDEILHGAGSSKFVYNFEIAGTTVAGISVIGARHLAAHYGGLKHRLIASVQKVDALFTFTSYPQQGMPMEMRCAVIPDLADEPDFYGAVVEIADIKTGNSVQIERRENRFERKRNGELYERPNYSTIAQSKAYRNAILSLIPQDVQIRWKEEMLKLRKNDTITDSVIDQKRSVVLQFATKHAIPLLRERVNDLTMDQISGLAQASHEGKVPAFAQAAQAIGIVVERAEPSPATDGGAPSQDPKPAAIEDQQRQRRARAPKADAPPPSQPQTEPPGDQRPEPPIDDDGQPPQGQSQPQPQQQAAPDTKPRPALFS